MWQTQLNTRVFHIFRRKMRSVSVKTQYRALIHQPKAEDHYDGKDHPHFSVRTSVVGSTLVGTFGQSGAGSRQISTNDLWRDMCAALCLSRRPVPTLRMANLSRALKGPIVI